MLIAVFEGHQELVGAVGVIEGQAAFPGPGVADGTVVFDASQMQQGMRILPTACVTAPLSGAPAHSWELAASQDAGVGQGISAHPNVAKNRAATARAV